MRFLEGVKDFLSAAFDPSNDYSGNSASNLSDTELLDELHKRRHRFSPDEYMSQDQCDDRAKVGRLRSAIVDLWKQDPTDPALSALHSLCDTLDSCYGNPLPARAFAVNTTLPGREDNYETHQSDMPV